ncbi:MAG TPA: response regulator [Candidatus Omnitrophota bacterium]|nr:response regulator [Candidatus Omnitrophota bacterium]HPD85646.1 response regulator [Candidatus Omnitrophota bacterium]HRZ04489.1 response regulator [Candidatus Omnitrophota bacterium]
MFIKKISELFVRPQPISGAGKKVLTVEDDVTQRTMIQKTLEKCGYEVLSAEDGVQGLEVAQNQKPDLILLDVIMPKMRGDEVCRRLKASDATRNIPVIFLTSLDTPKDIISHYELGGDIHLTKPINPKELIKQIEITLEEHSS